MARGKHQKAKANRDVKALSARLSAARDELAREQQMLSEAQALAAQVEAARTELLAATRDRDQHAATEEGRLRTEVSMLETLAKEFGAFEKQASDSWNAVTSSMVRRLGGGVEGLEMFMTLTGRSGFVGLSPRTDLGGLATQRIDRARGERSSVSEEAVWTSAAHPGRALVGLLRSGWREQFAPYGITPGHADATVAEDPEALAVADAAADQIARASVLDTNLDAMHAWHPLPWISLSQHPSDAGRQVLQHLGAIVTANNRETHSSPAPSGPLPIAPLGPTLEATRRQALATAGPERTESAWAARIRTTAVVTAASGRLPTPWSPQIAHPRPGDAVAIQHWYSSAAIGAWSKTSDSLGEADLSSRAVGEVALAMVSATPFWLPHGQVHSYASSLPLAAQDLADIRLPYPQVLITFADPLVLPALGEAQARALSELDNALLHLGHRKAQSDPATLLDLFGSIYDRSALHPQPALADALAQRGAHIEAILLLADSLGRLDDLFAWCVAIPADTGGVLGRFTLAARRSHGSFAPMLENFAAVAAWADWHPPDRELAFQAGASMRELEKLTERADFRKLEARGGAGGVRVLDVARTSAAERDGTQLRKEASMSPHPRRGHWRRQRYGPKNSLVKRVRIAPVIVNAGRGGMAPRVYRLPLEATSSDD